MKRLNLFTKSWIKEIRRHESEWDSIPTAEALMGDCGNHACARFDKLFDIDALKSGEEVAMASATDRFIRCRGVAGCILEDTSYEAVAVLPNVDERPEYA